MVALTAVDMQRLNLLDDQLCPLDAAECVDVQSVRQLYDAACLGVSLTEGDSVNRVSAVDGTN